MNCEALERYAEVEEGLAHRDSSNENAAIVSAILSIGYRIAAAIEKNSENVLPLTDRQEPVS